MIAIRGPIGHSSEGSTVGRIPAEAGGGSPMERLRATLMAFAWSATMVLALVFEGGQRWK
jgi:hypothetical protein